MSSASMNSCWKGSTHQIAGKCHYGGGGLYVVVLHGGSRTPGSARGLAEAMSSDFRIVEPLLRRSDQVSLTVDRQVEDLAAVAPDRAVIVGWSWGAMLGLSCAASYPKRVFWPRPRWLRRLRRVFAPFVQAGGRATARAVCSSAT
jgi:pimeloyl-ACP methyl ester carboxylesterase